MKKAFKINKWALLIGTLLMLFGGGSVIGAWGSYFTDTAVVAAGQQAQAVITAKEHFGPTVDTSDDWLIRYRFHLADGQAVEARRGISRALWDTLEKGSVVAVFYSAERPSRNFPAGEGNTSLAVCVYCSILGMVFVAVGVLIVVAGLGKGPKPVPGQNGGVI